ncbi:MAG: TraB/GumN family protein [Candidatus Delongbacteria bacterium]|nr:TraB/GumN family protein [Candidatus Delongbacteria bacterium]
MKKRFIIAVCLIMSFTLLIGADNFLWEVENGKNKAYLLGSIHIMPEDTYPLDDKIESAFKEADVLVVEVDITKIDQGKIQAFIAEKASYEEGKSLQTEIPADMYKSLSEKFEELGVPMAQIDIYKPWFVSMTLGLLGLQKLNVTAGQGIDLHFLNQANEKEMEILDLETAGAQLEILASNPDQVQIDYLQYSIDDYEQSTVVFMEMLDAWKTGDTEKMNKVSKVKMLELGEELPGIIDFYNKLFTERDEKILQKIIEHLENEDDHVYFIIVGALHLVGEDGLIKLLNDKGYKTKQY